MVTITVEDVEKALMNTLGKKGMKKEEIKKLAEYAMNFFGFSDTISDNLLKALKKNEIFRLANLKNEDETENEYKRIYNEVSDEIWSRNEGEY